MAYKKRSTEEIQQEVTNLVANGLEAIKSYSTSVEDRLELLNFMSDFYEYSPRNQSLILSQFEGARGVGSFKFFKDKGFSVNKGEKGIRILRPNFYTLFQDENGASKPLKYATQEQLRKIKNHELKSWEMRQYVPTSVFDITQTNAEPEDYPKLFPNKRESFQIEDASLLARLEKGLYEVAAQLDVPIHSEETSILGIRELGTAKGAFAREMNGDRREIVMNSRNTPSERVSVLIHELAHAKLHDPLQTQEGYWSTRNIDAASSSLKEFQAEMVSYVVSRHFGMDTSEFTIPYIATWTEKLKSIEKEGTVAHFELLGDIQQTSKAFITTISDVIEQERLREQQAALEVEQFAKKYDLEHDSAFSRDDLQELVERSKTVSNNQLLAEIDSHRSEMLVDWAYSGTKTDEEIKTYQEELSLNLKKKLLDGHHFYQVGEAIELLLIPGKEGDGVDFFILNEVGDVTTYSVPDNDAAFEKLKACGAFPVNILPSFKKFLSEDQSQEHQQQLIHDRVMRSTYVEETGRSMT